MSWSYYLYEGDDAIIAKLVAALKVSEHSRMTHDGQHLEAIRGKSSHPDLTRPLF